MKQWLRSGPNKSHISRTFVGIAEVQLCLDSSASFLGCLGGSLQSIEQLLLQEGKRREQRPYVLDGHDCNGRRRLQSESWTKVGNEKTLLKTILLTRLFT